MDEFPCCDKEPITKSYMWYNFISIIFVKRQDSTYRTDPWFVVKLWLRVGRMWMWLTRALGDPSD
jgi:hypothetical protein